MSRRYRVVSRSLAVRSLLLEVEREVCAAMMESWIKEDATLQGGTTEVMANRGAACPVIGSLAEPYIGTNSRFIVAWSSTDR